MSNFTSAFRTVLFLLVSSVFFLSCKPEQKERPFDLHGAWSLSRVIFYDGETKEFPDEANSGWLRIYDDSCFYACRIVPAPNGTMVMSSGKQTLSCIIMCIIMHHNSYYNSYE